MYGCNKPFWPLPYAKAYSLELDWILAELRKLQEGEGGTPIENVIQSIEEIKVALDAIVATPGTVYDAEKLGGVAADQYARKTDTSPDSLKLGGVAADQYARKTDTSPDSLKLGGVAADQYARKNEPAEDANKLGGVAASQYMQKTDTAYNSDRLGGWDASQFIKLPGLVQDSQQLGGIPAAQYAKKTDLPETVYGTSLTAFEIAKNPQTRINKYGRTVSISYLSLPTTATVNLLLFTLPPDLRPTYTVFAPFVGNGDIFGRLNIDSTTGECRLIRSSNTTTETNICFNMSYLV